MAKTILQTKCPYCNKEAHETKREEIDKELYISLTCGHTIIKEALLSSGKTITSRDGRTPYPFQLQTAQFLEEADCNGLCLHEQGLGKTIIECLLLSRNPQLLPALIVVKSGLRAQWFAEVFRWTGQVAQIITGSKDLPQFDLFDIFIVSIDTLRLLRPDIKVVSEWDQIAKGKKQPKVVWTDDICARFKHICVDESQKIKNPSSSRTQALRKIATLANDGQKARVICLSGTNIEKHAGEFFVTLNLTRPELFPHQSTYQMLHCEIDSNTGKIGGLRNPPRFKEMTKDFIIRYKREEVLPELPKVFRQFRLAELEGSTLDAYVKVVKEFQENIDTSTPTDILGYLSRMRHITGIAKVGAAVDYLEEFLLSTDRKIVVFLHHIQAGAILTAKMTKIMQEGAFAPPLVLSSELSMDERTAVVAEFQKPENRIMIAGTLVAGEGLNLQFCSDCLFLEQEWNPSQEEQAEGRFPRPGSTADKINAIYLIAAGTIDDFLATIKETKRRNIARTLDYDETYMEKADSILAELTKVLTSKGLTKWSL